MKAKIIEVLEESVGEYLAELVLDNDFLGHKAITIKGKTDILHVIKIQTSAHQDTTKKWTRATDCDKNVRRSIISQKTCV